MQHDHPRARRPPQGKAYSLFSNVAADIRALNASILIISQKMKYLVRNEKILGRNLLVLNKKIKALESGAPLASSEPGILPPDLGKKLEELTQAVSELQAAVEDIKQTYAKAEQVQEMKYVVDSINPLEFATFDDVEKIVEKHLGKSSSKSRKK